MVKRIFPLINWKRVETEIWSVDFGYFVTSFVNYVVEVRKHNQTQD